MSAMRVHHSLATIAGDYTKKQFVFRSKRAGDLGRDNQHSGQSIQLRSFACSLQQHCQVSASSVPKLTEQTVIIGAADQSQTTCQRLVSTENCSQRSDP